MTDRDCDIIAERLVGKISGITFLQNVNPLAAAKTIAVIVTDELNNNVEDNNRIKQAISRICPSLTLLKPLH